MCILCRLSYLIILVALTGVAVAEPHNLGKKKSGGFAGPNTAEGLLAEASEDKKGILHSPEIDDALEPWFEFKRDIDEAIGLQFGVNYTTTYQNATNAPDGAETDAASGIARYFSKWRLMDPDGPNTGSLVTTVDHRHKLGTDIAPADLGIEAGYLGIPATLFSDAGWLLVEVSWQQYFNDKQSGFIFGRYDPNDYLGVLGYANPWTTFQNLGILLNNSIALPDTSIGLGLGHRFEGGWYGNIAANDANGTIDDVEWFDDGSEFYKQAEIGWSPDSSKRFSRMFI